MDYGSFESSSSNADSNLKLMQCDDVKRLNHTEHRSNRVDITEPNLRFQRRQSAFCEVGLQGEDQIIDKKLRERPRLSVRFRSNVSVIDAPGAYSPSDDISSVKPQDSWLSHFLSQTTSAQILLLAVFISILISSFNLDLEHLSIAPVGVKAGAIPPKDLQPKQLPDAIPKRQNANTEVCKRWSGQSALVNGTLYYYGGRVTTSADQTSDTWNNDFISFDLTKSWQISSPSLTGLPNPSGPPAVSLGYLWSSTDALYLYGGEFSDSPVASPAPFSLWSYDIAGSKWNEHQNPTFADGGQPVQRAAEGAGISIPSLGRGYYFGGHLDGYTTPDWSQSIPRVYLQTLLEFTMPGFRNPSLQSSSPAGADGEYRNITADSAGFPERADGALVYVPGYGKSGVVLGLAGGTNQSFTQMNIIDVYDIAESKWYKQATSGTTPEIRVNPCTVAASSADGTSTQVYMYGGQNLLPYGQQTQYDDMWILTIPGFTWIKVNTDNQSVPPGRSGHTCNIWNSQMVVVGGYVGQDLSCDSPGVYVFNTSSLSWQNDYTALNSDDQLNRQDSQKNDPNALQGSYGYEVPVAVQSVIGGNAIGSATITAPAQTATQGPLATGKPNTYTVTGSDGSTATGTSSSGSGSGGSHTNVGAIVAGVIAGILFVMVLYLAFCAWLYRKQLRLYKNHVAVSQRAELTQENRFFVPFGATGGRYSDKDNNSSNNDRFSSDNRSGNSGQANTTNSGGRRQQLASNNPYNGVPGGAGYATAASSTEDLMNGQEPSFLGVMLNPRRSLRVVNRD